MRKEEIKTVMIYDQSCAEMPGEGFCQCMGKIRQVLQGQQVNFIRLQLETDNPLEAINTLEQEIAKVSSDVDNISSDLSDFKASVASLSSQRTIKLDFSNFNSGSFTETLENSEDPTITYDVDFDSSGRPIKLTCSDGHTLDIAW